MGDLVRICDYKRREELKALTEHAKRILDSVHYHDTAPSEMPPVQPSYSAPESDPA